MKRNGFGFSVYIGNYEKMKNTLSELGSVGDYIFTSFHIQEEVSDDFVKKAGEMCSWLNAKGFIIIGDVSPKTLKFFGYTDLLEFAEDYFINVLRIDYGLEENKISELSKEIPIAVNASTVSNELLDIMNSNSIAMHNFYPRPETGLSVEYFNKVNKYIKERGILVTAFVPGNQISRGPIYEGLPTLEKHRGQSTYVAYLDMLINYEQDYVFIGDILADKQDIRWMREYENKGIISVPVIFDKENEELYNQVFTIRVDSGAYAYRLEESREYSTTGSRKKVGECLKRRVGAITMDNEKYGRYSGEIQVIYKELLADDRVNVIGYIEDDYLEILESIKGGYKIQFVKLDIM